VRRRIPPVALVYLAGGAAALAGSLAVADLGSRRIEERLDENARMRAALLADRALADAVAALSARRAHLRDELGAALFSGDATSRSAAFFHEAARIAAQHRTSVTSIVPAVRVGSRLSFDLAVEGRYADLLATVRAFARLHAPAAIEVSSLTRKNPNLSDATLIAALHANLGAFDLTDAADERAASN
jgi:hypothetical protein